MASSSSAIFLCLVWPVALAVVLGLASPVSAERLDASSRRGPDPEVRRRLAVMREYCEQNRDAARCLSFNRKRNRRAYCETVIDDPACIPAQERYIIDAALTEVEERRLPRQSADFE